MANTRTLIAKIEHLAQGLNIAADRLPNALANLTDHAPGFSATTVGAAPAPAGHALIEDLVDIVANGGKRDGVALLAALHAVDNEGQPVGGAHSAVARRASTVERTALGHDIPRQHRARIEQILNDLEKPHTELYSLIGIWHFQATRPKRDPDEEHKWCTSCLRLDVCRERHRGELCQWCYDFQLNEQRLPSTDLLDKHHQKIRVTKAMIKADHPARRRTKSGKKAKRAAAAKKAAA